MSNERKPLPEFVSVDSNALSQLITALNGPPHLILEILHTRRLPRILVDGLPSNPLDVLEDRLEDYAKGTIPQGPINVKLVSEINFDEAKVKGWIEAMLLEKPRLISFAIPECPYERDADYENCAMHNYRRLGDYKPDVEAALKIANDYGGIDGSHHKEWVIDQMVRSLTGTGYSRWVEVRKLGPNGEDKNDPYEWSEGIAP